VSAPHFLLHLSVTSAGLFIFNRSILFPFLFIFLYRISILLSQALTTGMGFVSTHP